MIAKGPTCCRTHHQVQTTGIDDGQAAAFRSLFERFYREIWTFARNRTSSGDDASDIAAETFTIAWRRIDELLGADQPRAWLFATARFVLANQLRGRRRRERLVDRLADARATIAVLPDATTGDLAVALDELASADREILLLHAWDDLATSEIATMLGCTPNAAAIRLHRARQRLAAALDERTRLERPEPSRTPHCRQPDLKGTT